MIIITVLLNAGLLAILFVMAINTDDDKVKEPSEMSSHLALRQQNNYTESSKPAAIAYTTSQMISSQGGDELDNVLKEYAVPPQTVVLDEEQIEEIEKEIPKLAVVSPAAEQKPSASLQYVQITVKRGDSLDKIARANNTTIDAIKKANNLTHEKISIGQQLQIPIASVKKPNESPKIASAPATVASSIQSSKEDIEYYTIKSGDNPWKIAKQFHVRFDDLLKLNNLDEEKARNLRVGDKIRVK